MLLVAEVEALSANPSRPARGSVIEAHLDKKTGAVASVLVATGTLRVGDAVQAGATYGRVSALLHCAPRPLCAGCHCKIVLVQSHWTAGQSQLLKIVMRDVQDLYK